MSFSKGIIILSCNAKGSGAENYFSQLEFHGQEAMLQASLYSNGNNTQGLEEMVSERKGQTYGIGKNILKNAKNHGLTEARLWLRSPHSSNVK